VSGTVLQPSLKTVLINFREGEVAWSSDVEAMIAVIVSNIVTPIYFVSL
jgi:hypothetical protein